MRPKLNHQSNGSPNSVLATAVTTGPGTLSTTSVAVSTSTTSPTTSGIVNPVFVPDLVAPNGNPPPPPTAPKPSKQPLHKQRSSTSTTGSESSSESTVVTTASDNRRTLTTSSVEIGDQHSTSTKQLIGSGEPSCDYCYRFHVNHHRAQVRVHKTPSPLFSHASPSSLSTPYQPSYAPYPPQWYYLLAADTKQFRKHKHSHYRRDCKVCRQIVRQTFEQYYLRSDLPAMPSSTRVSDRVDGSGSNTPDSGSLVPVSLMSDHSDPLLESAPSSTSSPFPLVFLPRRRANCGHSCLKYSILFYCSVAVILAICFICYLTKMFGYLEVMPSMPTEPAFTSSPIDVLSTVPTPSFNGSDEFFTSTTTTASPLLSTTTESTAATASSVFEMVRFEVVGIIVCSALMIIFFLGLIGAFLESILCLRIFGAILSYLFLLTFGAALYIIILLVISRVPAKLVLSTVSCSAVAITLHAALAIAPFAFADLIYQERQDDKNELSSTYFKYPSVRFLPPGAHNGHKARSHFSLPFLGGGGGRVWGPSRAFLGGGGGGRMMHAPHSSRPSSSIPNSSRTSPVNQDNLSSEGLIPSSQHSHPSTVRFNDNWI